MSDLGIVNAYWSYDRLHLVERAADGGVQVRTEPAEHSCCVRDAALTADRWDVLRRSPHVVRVVPEGPYRRVHFADRDLAERFCRGAEKDGIPTYEGMVSPVVRYMADRAPKVARPRICYLDLEADSRVPFSRKTEARTLCWAVVGEGGEQHQACLRSDTDARERDLYAELWDVLDDYDLVAAWNGDRYDFEVIKARSQLHRLVGAQLDVRRWLWLDHMVLFERMNMSAAESGEEKQSVALEAVGQAVLGEGKLDFDASKTWQAWADGGEPRRRLQRYNLHDAALMPRIEQKTGYVELLLSVGEACGTFADSRGVNPSVQVEGFLQRLAVQRAYKFPTAVGARQRNYEKFKGAWVMDPTCSGIQRSVHVCDFARLYPSVILSLNMSPETLLGTRAEGEQKGYGQHAWCPPTGACFDTTVQGILPAALEEMLRLRKYWGDLEKAATPGTPEHQEAHRRSAAYKIATNSFYGVIGQAISRFFDRTVAESVAQGGVWLIGKTIEAAEQRGMRCIYGDTDSLFVVGVGRAEFEAFVAWCNAELYPRLLREVGAAQNRVALEYDKQFERFIISRKKRYIASYAHSKGTAATAASKPEIKGFEFKRGDSLQLVRDLQQEVAHRLLGFRGPLLEQPEDFDELLVGWAHRVLGEPLRLQDVLVSKRLGKPLDGYARKVLKDGSGYARQLPHIELARELGQRGHDVGEGAKIDYVVVDPAGKPQRVVAAVEWDGQLDRAGLWGQQVFPPTRRLLEAAFPAHDWSVWADLEDWGGDAPARPAAMMQPDEAQPSQPAPARRGRRLLRAAV